jgi:hypothetical protein
MDESVPFGSRDYFVFLALLVTGRGADFLSTWVATPNLVLEANPIAKKLGWRWGMLVNAVLCGVVALWPLPAVIFCTTSLLVASHNFERAWLMRALGEDRYRRWMAEAVAESRLSLTIACYTAQTVLGGSVGLSLVWFGGDHLIPLGVGLGIIGYAVAVSVFSLVSLWRGRKGAGAVE